VFGDAHVPFPHPDEQMGVQVDLWLESERQVYPDSIVQLAEHPSPFKVLPSSQGSHSVLLLPQAGPATGHLELGS